MRNVNVLGMLWVASLAVLGAWFGFMLLDTTMPVEYSSEGAMMIPDPVDDGGRVTVRLNIKRNRVCPGTVSRVLRDEATGRIVSVYDPVPEAYADGLSQGSLSKTFELPEGLPPRVRYQAKVCFQCNPLQMLQPICTTTPDIVFSVKQQRQ